MYMEISFDYNLADSYDMYKLIDEKRIYPPLLINKWFYAETKSFANNKSIVREEYIRLVQVDENTFYHCYCKIFNPICISLSALPGKAYNKELIGELKIGLNTIDDSYYGVRFENVSREQVEELIDKVDEYLNSVDYLSKTHFLDFLVNTLKGKLASY